VQPQKTLPQQKAETKQQQKVGINCVAFADL